MQIQCEECGQMIGVNFDELDRDCNGSSGDGTTSFTYSGDLKCLSCGTNNFVEIDTDELDGTDEILDYERRTF